MKRYLPHFGIVLGVAIAVYALFFSETDEEKIQALLERFEDAVAVTPDDTNLVLRAARVKKELSEIFTQEVSFDIPELSSVSSGRDEFIGLAAKAPQIWRAGEIDLSALSITVDEAGVAAVAVGDARLNATRQDGQIQRDARKVSISLEKIEGAWKIVALTVSAKDDAA